MFPVPHERSGDRLEREEGSHDNDNTGKRAAEQEAGCPAATASRGGSSGAIVVADGIIDDITALVCRYCAMLVQEEIYRKKI